jgi:hypothetical protein
MITLSYISRARYHFSNDELLSLLMQARAHNREANITGLLLYNGNDTFLQAIEGSEEQIDKLYLSISADNRHTDVTCINRTAINERDFPNCRMGFRNLSTNPPKNVKGLSDFMQADSSADYILQNTHVAHTIINCFKNTSQEILL